VLIRRLLVVIAGALAVAGCQRSDQANVQQVVLYTSVDEPVARPIVRAFEAETGIQVVLQTDAEATKSVGLAERLRAERSHPQADVFWSNEPFHTVNLAGEGVLAAYESRAAVDVPAQYKSAEGLWTSVGLRARVIAASSKESAPPRELLDLTQSKWKGKLAMARPTAGTTGGHVAALYVLWGEEKARTFFKGLRANEIALLGGNSVVAERVAMGNYVAGLTDNDDCHAASAEIAAVQMIFPDQSTIGTLMVPTAVGLVAGAPHDDAAKKLIDFLVTKATEQKLIDANFVIASVRDATLGGKIKPMQLDYEKAARVMPQAVREATAILEGRE
jgi:iron(III) transport system substrate-binding protein